MSSSPDRGEPVLRGSRAQSVTAARWQVDLRQSTEVPIPDEVIERATESARAAGYAEGWAQGQREARAAAEVERAKVAAAQREYEQARAALLERALGAGAGAAQALEGRTVPVVTELAEQVLHGAVELAEALLGRELTDSPDRGLDALRRVMAVAPESGTVTVRLHPDDLAALGAEHPYRHRDITLVPDPTLVPGDAVAEQGTTTVDARLSEAIGRVRAELTR